MNRILIVFTVLMLLAATGCGFVADGPFGWAYTDSKTPVALGTAKTGSKEGQACIHSFFGAVSVGDGSIETAMKSAGIKEIYSINKKNLSIFGTYTRQCTVVSGE
jgi:hypothetical protein